MKKYTVNQYDTELTQSEKMFICNLTECDNKRKKYFSILAFRVKYLKENWSAAKWHRKHQSYIERIRIGLTHFKNLLKDLQPLIENRLAGLEVAVTSCDEKVTKKVTILNQPQSIENSSLEPILKNNNNIKDNINYTNTIKRKGFLTRKELRLLAEDILFKTGVRDITVKAIVFKKIYNLKSKIHVNGAISYLKKMITEKLIETTLEYVVDNDRESELLYQMGAYL